jgi:hypothetical protein
VASHYPLARADGDPPPDQDWVAGPLRRAIRDSGLPVQIALGGHEHALYAAELPGGGLQLVAGSGGQVFPAAMRYEDAFLARAELGFARIDLVRGAEGEHLEATLYAAPWGASLLGRPAEPAARFSVDRDGRVRAELAPGPSQ